MRDYVLLLGGAMLDCISAFRRVFISVRGDYQNKKR